MRRLSPFVLVLGLVLVLGSAPARAADDLTASERAAVDTLQKIWAAQATYREGDRDGNGKHDYAPSLEALASAKVIDAELAAGVKAGYRLRIAAASESAFAAVAVPEKPGAAAGRSFSVDDAGLFRAAPGGEEPTASSGPIDVSIPQSAGQIAMEKFFLEIQGIARDASDLLRASQDLKTRRLGERLARLGAHADVILKEMRGARYMTENVVARCESAAIGALRAVAAAQAKYREGEKKFAPSLEALGNARLIDPVLATGANRGYAFRLLGADEGGFRVLATPQEPGVSGNRTFFLDESGVIRFELAPAEANEKSTAIGG